MGHHSGYPFEQSQMSEEELKKFFDEVNEKGQDPCTPKSLGATGKFPDGKLTNTDEGEIRIVITNSNGRVIIDFGKPTHWVGFTKEQAIQIATSLLNHAEQC